MKKSTIIWLVVAASLTLSGALIFTGVMSSVAWDFTTLSSGKYVTNTYEIAEDFKDISIKLSTADITILPSEDGVCRVVSVEKKKILHTVAVEGETLRITEDDTRKWYEHIELMSMGSTSITIYLPKPAYNAIMINGSTCDISVEGLNVIGLNFKLSTGDVSISNVTCVGNISLQNSTGTTVIKNSSVLSLITNAGTGDITLENVIAKENFEIARSTGDVKFTACDASEIYVQTGTGDVTGTLLTDKIFTANTSTGDVRVPSSSTGGKCEITTSTGDIVISIAQ